MASRRSQVNRSLQNLLAQRPRPDAAFKTIDDLERQLLAGSTDHRAMVLIGSALVESFLEEVILVQCTRKFDRDWRGRLFGAGPEGQAVQGFYGKILLAHALGIYNTAFFEDLDRIRRIRNAFAHTHKPLSLNSSFLKTACDFHCLNENLGGIDPTVRYSKPGPPHRFLEAVGLISVVLSTLAEKNRRFRPRARRNSTWVYAEPPPSPGKSKQPNQRNRRRASSNDRATFAPALIISSVTSISSAGLSRGIKVLIPTCYVKGIIRKIFRIIWMPPQLPWSMADTRTP